MKINKIKFIVFLLLFSLFLFFPNSNDLFSQSENCKNAAANALLIVAKTLQSKGFSLNGTTPRYGALKEGEAAGFSTLLVKGNQYAFVVAGGCVATIELYVYDESKNLVGEYNGGEPFAAVVLNPNYTGQYYGVVKLRGTTEDPAVVVQLLGWKKIL